MSRIFDKVREAELEKRVTEGAVCWSSCRRNVLCE
jgi:hypothetical protein